MNLQSAPWRILLITCLVSGCAGDSVNRTERHPIDTHELGAFVLGENDVANIQMRAIPTEEIKLTTDGPIISEYEFKGQNYFDLPALYRVHVLNDSLVIGTGFHIDLSEYDISENEAYLDRMADSLFTQYGLPDSSSVSADSRNWTWAGLQKKFRVNAFEDFMAFVSLEREEMSRLASARTNFPEDSSTALSSSLDLAMSKKEFEQAGLPLREAWFQYEAPASTFSNFLFGSPNMTVDNVRFSFFDNSETPSLIGWTMEDLEPIIAWAERRFGYVNISYERSNQKGPFYPKIDLISTAMAVNSRWTGEHYVIHISAL